LSAGGAGIVSEPAGGTCSVGRTGSGSLEPDMARAATGVPMINPAAAMPATSNLGLRIQLPLTWAPPRLGGALR
jgi:hypothetical protein